MTDIGQKRKEAIPKSSIFWEEKASVQRGWIYADMLSDHPPIKLQRWMRKEGIAHIPERVDRRYVIGNKLKREGVWEQSQEWRAKTIKEMQRWNYEKLTLPTARELCWRILPQKMAHFAKKEAISEESTCEVAEEVSEELISGMEFLPGWMRWCVLHPGLMFTAEQVMEDTTLDETCQRYVSLYPCPHQAAMNQFTLYRGDKKLIDGLFKEIGRLHTAAIKAGGASNDDQKPEDSEEEKAITTLESLLK